MPSANTKLDEPEEIEEDHFKYPALKESLNSLKADSLFFELKHPQR